jgi:hypothetical protein
VFNLYAFITPYPDVLFAQDDPVGHPRNNEELLTALRYDTLVLAWGVGATPGRVQDVLTMWRRAEPFKQLWCLGVNRAGSPKHPLYQPRETRLVPYPAQGAP